MGLTCGRLRGEARVYPTRAPATATGFADPTPVTSDTAPVPQDSETPQRPRTPRVRLRACGRAPPLGGSVLDNSVILVYSENAEGGHTKVNMPFLLIVSGGGHFKTGRHVQCGGAPHNRLLLSIAGAFGLPGPDGSPDHFGDPDFGGGPLSGLT